MPNPTHPADEAMAAPMTDTPDQAALAACLERAAAAANETCLSLPGEPSYALEYSRRISARRQLQELLVENLPTILAALRPPLPPPASGDVVERAREYVASSMHDRDKSWGDLVRAGERDDCPEMRMVLKAMRTEAALTQPPADQSRGDPHEFAQNYEFTFAGGQTHVPTDAERAMIEDAINAWEARNA